MGGASGHKKSAPTKSHRHQNHRKGSLQLIAKRDCKFLSNFVPFQTTDAQVPFPSVYDPSPPAAPRARTAWCFCCLPSRSWSRSVSQWWWRGHWGTMGAVVWSGGCRYVLRLPHDIFCQFFNYLWYSSNVEFFSVTPSIFPRHDSNQLHILPFLALLIFFRTSWVCFMFLAYDNTILFLCCHSKIGIPRTCLNYPYRNLHFF